MPRIAQQRPPAEPHTPEQHERVKRILRAAARQGALKDLEKVQMTDVAADAGVAIATLYRYFPSKTVLFTAVMRHRVEVMYAWVDRLEAHPPAEAVSQILIQAGRELLKVPKLARAMMTSNNIQVTNDRAISVDSIFKDLLARAARLDEPTGQEARRLRLVEQVWYGILISALNGVISEADAEADTDEAVQLLLGGLWA